MYNIEPVELLRRQYLQLMDPQQLSLPSRDLLRMPETQARIHSGMFNESKIFYPPPDRYRFRVLKRLVNALEEAIVDPEEDEISDDISSCLAQYMVQPLPSASAAAQQKSYVTYTTPIAIAEAPQITLLEAPSLLASAGTTGFRTWEAALFLGAYLVSPDGHDLVSGKDIIELGAGTGFLSILCAKYLGAHFVMSTDGSREVVTDIKTNLGLNDLDEGNVIQNVVLPWGYALINGVTDRREANLSFDLVIGADVTYDLKSIPALISTLRDLFELYPQIKVLVSATVRNVVTLASFTKACLNNSFTLKQLDVPMRESEEQIGFFVPTKTPISILLITKEGPANDPFAF